MADQNKSTQPQSDKIMLIDGAHSEELRVGLLQDDILQDFESETQDKAQLKGNIYIAEVSRVEPSLQAAFITYGGNRNGFLAFSEVHPSFFNIEDSEKELLIKELIALAERRKNSKSEDNTDNAAPAEAAAEDDEDARALALANSLEPEQTTDATKPMGKFRRMTKALMGQSEPELPQNNKVVDEKATKATKAKPAVEKNVFEIPRTPIHRRFHIGDVLKAGQKILVQVVKEERGNKGAALTTYFTLPGRYTVMMPNNPQAGGISRKINDASERNALRKVYDSLDIPEMMGLIVRTAGGELGQHEKAEENIKADFKHLKTRWEDIQKAFEAAKKVEKNEITCVHEDGSLIIRALRDMAKDDVTQIIISGARAYNQAKDYAQSLMPETAKLVKEYKAQTPIFNHYGVEQQLNQLHHTRVQLPSGGYLVIQPTEALVSVDVNSGRATQGKNIEDTALKTNMEAGEELARQIRLRDLSGLIVVDFIDMENTRHARQVERLMRKFSRQDRARMQVSNVSDFGLLQISRQRLRPSFAESHYTMCETCNGTGITHTEAAAASMLLRRLEEEDVRDADKVIVHAHPDLVVYILNHKRSLIDHMEATYKYKLLFSPDAEQMQPDALVELVRMKSDGSETGQTLNIVMREQPELPPEVRYSKEGRKLARDEARAKAKEAKKTAARKAEDGGDDTPEHKSDTRADKNADGKSEGRSDTRRRRGPRRPRSKETEQTANTNVEATPTTDAKPAAKNAPRTRRAPTRKTAENTETTATAAPIADTPEEKKPARGRPRKAAVKTEKTADKPKTAAKPTAATKTAAKPKAAPKKKAEKIVDKPLAVVTVGTDGKEAIATSTANQDPKFQRWWSKAE